MYPFQNTWPYEVMGGEIYFHKCPFCGKEQARTPLTVEDALEIRGGAKRLLVMPCCHNSCKVLDADDDYLLTNRRLQRR